MLKHIYKKIKKLATPPTDRELRVREWKRGENEELRYKYNLDENSVVFDLGGYKGEWTSDIFSRYVCIIYIFEPVEKYYEDIRKRFSKNPYIKIFRFGLGSQNTQMNIGMSDDGSSTFNNNSTEQELIELKKTSEFLANQKIQNVDLIKINIEGGEYDLLEHLIESECISMFRNIQVQFHDFVPQAKDRMENIRKKLQKTHRVTYQVEFVWENWKLK